MAAQLYQLPDRTWQEVPTPIALAVVIRSALLNALAFTDGRQDEAGKLLGLSPQQMGRKMLRHSIPMSRRRAPRRKGR